MEATTDSVSSFIGANHDNMIEKENLIINWMIMLLVEETCALTDLKMLNIKANREQSDWSSRCTWSKARQRFVWVHKVRIHLMIASEIPLCEIS